MLPEQKWKTSEVSKVSNYDDFPLLKVSFLVWAPHILLLKAFFSTAQKEILTVSVG